VRSGRPRYATRTTLTVAALSLIAMILGPVNAGAKPPVEVKPYRAVLSPSTALASSETLALTLYNDSSNQELGSADLRVPTGLTITNVVGGTYVASTRTIQYRSLSIAPGTMAQVGTFRAAASCAGGDFDFQITAKQSNNFSGPPGNDFVLVAEGSNLTVSFPTDACELRFITQPKDAQIDMRITGTQDFGAQLSPPDATSPQVALVDPASGDPIASFTGAITVTLDPGSGTLAGTTSRAADGGVATFDNLSVDEPGTYTLEATTSGAAPESSDQFEIVPQFCPEDVDCTTSFTGNGGQSRTDITLEEFNPDLDTDAGALISQFITQGALLDCNYADGTPYTEFTNFEYFYTFSNDERFATITTVVKKRLFNEISNNGASKLEVCFDAKGQTFLDDAGQETTSHALLPTCNKVDASMYPCIVNQFKQGADAVVVYTVPGSYNSDPRGRS